MKAWFLGGTGSSGTRRGRGSGLAGRLDRFVTEIAQGVQDQTPANYAVDANYQLIPTGIPASVSTQVTSARDRGILSSARRRLLHDPHARG